MTSEGPCSGYSKSLSPLALARGRWLTQNVLAREVAGNGTHGVWRISKTSPLQNGISIDFTETLMRISI